MIAFKSIVFLVILLQFVLCDKYHAKSQAGKTQAFAKEGKILTYFRKKVNSLLVNKK
jgi:hypothetical protein